MFSWYTKLEGNFEVDAYINRCSLELRAKQSVVDWLNSGFLCKNDAEFENITINDLNKDSLIPIFLIDVPDDGNLEKEKEDCLKNNYKFMTQKFFSNNYSINYPEDFFMDFSYELFCEWFDIKLHTLVYDLGTDYSHFEIY